MEYLSDKDTATHHICGTCHELKPVSAFYKDGTDSEGNVRYRRDCKECYKNARIQEAVAKSNRRMSIGNNKN
jgi:hypothetical protein